MTTYHATKYDSAAHEVVALLADEATGYGRESFGDVEAPTGFVQVVVLDDTCDLDFSDHTNYPVGDEVGETAREYGVTADDVRGTWIVQTGSQGFVDVARYDSAEEFMVTLAALASMWAEYDGE